MSSQQQSIYSDDLSSYDSQNDQLIKAEFMDIFHEGIDPNLCFYKAYCRLHLQNLDLINRVEMVMEQNKQLDKRVKLVRKHYGSKEEITQQEEKKKRSRRTAGQIRRHYICNYQICQKSYGSEGSLNQHIKLKHDGIPFSQ